MIQTNDLSNLTTVIHRHISVHVTFETRKRNKGFYVLREEFQRDGLAKDMLVLNKSSL